MTIIDPTKIPAHVAIIMDGNGRWAKKWNRPRLFGHQKGADTVRTIVEVSGEIGIKALTLYAFSEENWGRPNEEVSGLFSLLKVYLQKELKKLHKEGIRLRVIGNIDRIPSDCKKPLLEGIELTKNNNGLTLVLALSYGGRSEIIKACKKVVNSVKTGEVSVEDIDEELISKCLDTNGLPELDFVIRTSGEQRLSNFLLWQVAYAELYFTSVSWPEFTKERFLEALAQYQKRGRRFGKLSPDEYKVSPQVDGKV